MRGRAFPLPVPTGGLVLNMPPHQVPPNALTDGSNMYLDIDGLLKPRSGYTPLAMPGPATTAVTNLFWNTDTFLWSNNPYTWQQLGAGGSHISGGVSYRDSNLSAETVVATLGDWYSFRDGVWIAITDPAAPQGGSANSPARFAVFSQGGVYYAVGVNNVNQMRRWTGGLPTYLTIAAAPIARDILVLANRVVAFNTTEAGTPFPRRARWSKFEDSTLWPALNFNDTLDSDDAIVGAAKLGQGAAAIYGGKSIWVIQSNPGGSDASSFTTQEIFSALNYSGPISTAAIVVAEGAHYYMGTDGRVYQFNGIQPQAISDPVDPAVLAQINLGFGSRCHAVYLPIKRALVFFWPALTTGADCRNYSYFSLARQVWEPIGNFKEGISASWQATLDTGQTWANDPYTWVTSPYTWDDIPNASALAVFIGTTAGDVHNFFKGNSDNGLDIPYSAIGPLFSADPSQTHQVDRFEVYLQQGTTEEIITMDIHGFGAPFQAAVPVVSMGTDISLPQNGWFNQMSKPGPNNPSNVESNYLRVRIYGLRSAGGFGFGGGTLYLTFNAKSDYGSQ